MHHQDLPEQAKVPFTMPVAAIPHLGGVLRNYVAGEFRDSDAHFDNINPVDGSVINRVAEADAQLVDEAVHAAHRALAGNGGRYQ